MKSKAKLGLKQMLRQASAKFDPTKKQAADRLGDDLVHAIAVKDPKAAEKAVNGLARLFLKMSADVSDA